MYVPYREKKGERRMMTRIVDRKVTLLVAKENQVVHYHVTFDFTIPHFDIRTLSHLRHRAERPFIETRYRRWRWTKCSSCLRSRRVQATNVNSRTPQLQVRPATSRSGLADIPELLKRYRPTEAPDAPEGPAASNGKGKGKAATVAEEEEEEDEDMAYAGGELPSALYLRIRELT
jgi:hypothetical protein